MSSANDGLGRRCAPGSSRCPARAPAPRPVSASTVATAGLLDAQVTSAPGRVSPPMPSTTARSASRIARRAARAAVRSRSSHRRSRAPGRRTEITTLSRPAPLAATIWTRPGRSAARGRWRGPPARSCESLDDHAMGAPGAGGRRRHAPPRRGWRRYRAGARERPLGDDDRDGRRGVDPDRAARVRRRGRAAAIVQRRAGGTPARGRRPRAPWRRPAALAAAPGESGGAARPRGRAGAGGAGVSATADAKNGPHALAGSGEDGRAQAARP